jgi:hypothetical protein
MKILSHVEQVGNERLTQAAIDKEDPAKFGDNIKIVFKRYNKFLGFFAVLFGVAIKIETEDKKNICC